jgi:hypothetical protein
MPPVCDKAFWIEKFVCLDLPGFGKGAVGREEGGGCSSHTKPMLIEPEGDDDETRKANFDYLKEELEKALAQGKAARLP